MNISKSVVYHKAVIFTADEFYASVICVHILHNFQHKLRVQSLLDEERATNPSLPTLERLLQMDTHIDNYGFKHTHRSEGIVLHYVCQQLHHYYNAQLSSFENHQHRWKEVLTKAKTLVISTVTKVCILYWHKLRVYTFR